MGDKTGLSDEQRKALETIYTAIEERALPIAAGHAWWPCRKGCDLCCRTLGDLPMLTQVEWEYAWEGFMQLTPEVRAQVRARVAELAAEDKAGVERKYYTCPLLDQESGACTIYHHRPEVCRTYGFFVTRYHGNWCEKIVALLDEHGDEGIIWGNQTAVNRMLDNLESPMIGLLDWFERHPE